MWKNPIAALALLSLFATGAPAQAELAVYTTGGVKIMSKTALQPRQLNGYRKFKARAKDFYGAYYISPGSDDGTFWVDEHSLKDAQFMAARACRDNARSKVACKLYAVIVPAGTPKGAGKPFTRGNGSLSRELSRSQRKAGYGAAATGRVGQWGISWGHKSRDAARRDALETCARNIKRASFQKQLSPAFHNELLSAGRYDCRIVTDFRN